jgi:RimJ/RimL family protein N-acetyltransferase
MDYLNFPIFNDRWFFLMSFVSYPTFLLMQILETENLTLHELSPEDAPFIFELLNTSGWIRFIGDRGIKTLSDASDYLSARLIPSYRQFGFGFYLVKLKSQNIPAGICGLVKRASLEDVDLGYAFLPAFEGKGYALQASRAVLDHAFRNLKMVRIVAITNTDNFRSIRLLEKLGMKREKTFVLPGEKAELFLYGINQ